MTRDIQTCPDGAAHVWGRPTVYGADHGPMEGRWHVAECVRCGVGSLRSIDAPQAGLEALLAALGVTSADEDEAA